MVHRPSPKSQRSTRLSRTQCNSSRPQSNSRRSCSDARRKRPHFGTTTYRVAVIHCHSLKPCSTNSQSNCLGVRTTAAKKRADLVVDMTPSFSLPACSFLLCSSPITRLVFTFPSTKVLCPPFLMGLPCQSTLTSCRAIASALLILPA